MMSLTWLTLVSGVVATCTDRFYDRFDVTGGGPLENFLENYLDRKHRSEAGLPE